MLCKRSSLVKNRDTIHRKIIVKPLKQFVKGDKAIASLLLILTFPVIMAMMIFFENIMEVKYVHSEVQTILDLSTRGAAMTGDGVKSGSNVICTIPYDEDDEENSGYHVARKLLRTNLYAGTLPRSASDSIWRQVLDETISGFNTHDTDQWASGKARIDLTFSYTPTASFFGKKYRVHVVSIAKCTASSASDDDGDHLTQQGGTFQGPSGKETYYNCDMSGVVQIMRNLGYSEEEYPYHVREDGVKMLGDYVMVAADLTTRPRGAILETSVGKAMVCDTGGFTAHNPTQLDVAVSWGSISGSCGN